MSFFQRLFAPRPHTDRIVTQTTSDTSKHPQPVAGERHHRSDVPYALPTDLTEGERLNLQHYLFRHVLKGNHASPLDKDTVSAILDVGSGTGIWGHEIAQEFPHARVIGLDMEPAQALSRSSSAMTPPTNYQYVQGNLFQGLPFPDSSFNFTHQRMLALAVPAKSWPQCLNELVRVTRPGGWIELLEIGATINHAGPASLKLLDWTQRFLLKRGIDAKLMENLAMLAENAGMKQIQSHYLDLPVGTWNTRVGALLETDCLAAYSALKAGICSEMNVDPAIYDNVLKEAPIEWNKYRASYRFSLVYGQA